MTSSPITSSDLVLLDIDAGADKEAVIGRLARLLADDGRADDGWALQQAALAREAQSATGLPGGIAIPHCRSAAARQPSIGTSTKVSLSRLQAHSAPARPARTSTIR